MSLYGFLRNSKKTTSTQNQVNRSMGGPRKRNPWRPTDSSTGYTFPPRLAWRPSSTIHISHSKLHLNQQCSRSCTYFRKKQASATRLLNIFIERDNLNTCSFTGSLGSSLLKTPKKSMVAETSFFKASFGLSHYSAYDMTFSSSHHRRQRRWREIVISTIHVFPQSRLA
jgi:hypothetical protein